MDDHAAMVLFDLLATHQADIFAAANGDDSAIPRIALSSRYSRDSVAMAARLLARQILGLDLAERTDGR